MAGVSPVSSVGSSASVFRRTIQRSYDVYAKGTWGVGGNLQRARDDHSLFANSGTRKGLGVRPDRGQREVLRSIPRA